MWNGATLLFLNVNDHKGYYGLLQPRRTGYFTLWRLHSPKQMGEGSHPESGTFQLSYGASSKVAVLFGLTEEELP